jgi:hypothetical protein
MLGEKLMLLHRPLFARYLLPLRPKLIASIPI